MAHYRICSFLLLSMWSIPVQTGWCAVSLRSRNCFSTGSGPSRESRATHQMSMAAMMSAMTVIVTTAMRKGVPSVNLLAMTVSTTAVTRSARNRSMTVMDTRMPARLNWSGIWRTPA